MYKIPVVVARTHPPEYRLHKYWSRKPHNVLSHFMSELLQKPGVVVDPFCGSGVALREATLLGHEAIGFDLNPAAVLISRVTLNPPDPEKLVEALRPGLEYFSTLCDRAFGRKSVKYVVHQVVTKCPGCSMEVTSKTASKTGRKRTCPKCSTPLRFNVETMVGTRVEAVAYVGERGLDRGEKSCIEQEKLSSMKWGPEDPGRWKLHENRRILAFDGMRVADLYTRRNLGLLGWFSEFITGLQNDEVRDAAMLLLSASSAQCSRLIPYRNNLSTGGPAWSVPGFWMPPVHLETNPLVHINARLKRLCAGLGRLRANKPSGRAQVVQSDASEGLERLACGGKKADLVFLDPPYGDSVPYLEFSSVWNAFLQQGEQGLDLQKDLSVSDRKDVHEPWKSYHEGLKNVMERVSSLMSDDGKLLVTFNNNDLRAWDALLRAVQNSGFRCEFVTYQLPAVVPAKACFSPKTSYVGDLYAVFVRRIPNTLPSRNMKHVVRALRRSASARNGLVPENLVRRMVAVAWLEHDLDVELLAQGQQLVKSLFVRHSPGLLKFLGTLDESALELEELVRGAAAACLCQGKATWEDMVEAVAEATCAVGMPEASEIRSMLQDQVPKQSLERKTSA